MSIFRYCLLPFFFFPLVIAATWAGAYWPLAYLLFAVAMYVVVDNMTPPLTSVQSRQEAVLNNFYIFLQLPLSLLLTAVYLTKIRLMNSDLESIPVLGVPLGRFSGIGEAISAAFAIGVHFGSNFVVAHEMMHRPSKFWKFCSRTLLVCGGDAQFLEAHLYGHHSAVGTRLDPATARRGESFYGFFIRSVIGQFKSAHVYERARLSGLGAFERLIQHRVLRGNIASLLLFVAVAWFSGIWGVVCYLLISIVAKAVLESVNYIQHYGLSREERSRVEPHHSWECDARGSSMYLYNLTRHAEHHVASRTPFWQLRVQPTPYRLPHGYMVAIVMAMIPQLWRHYSDRLFEAASRHGLPSPSPVNAHPDASTEIRKSALKISITGKSDYLALLTGNPKFLKFRASEPLAARLQSLPRAAADAPRVVLLLGATGFVGMHVLNELLNRPNVTKVYALVRKKRAASPKSRLDAATRGFGLALQHTEKLEVLEGDFTANDHFGLSDDDYATLCSSVDIVLNAAGATNHTFPYAYFRSETIVPLLWMMEFCATQRQKSLHFIGSMNGEVFRSMRDFMRIGFYHCGYSRMKWIVKYLAIWSREQGITTTLYLPPHILGSQLTAFKDPGLRYSFWHMIWYASQLGKLWDAKDPVPVISADALAREVCDNSLNDNPRLFAYPSAYISMAELAKTFGWELVPWKEFRKQIKRRYTISLRNWDWKRPFGSIFDMFLHMFFTRSLFTSDLPELISTIALAGQRNEPPAPTDLPPSRFVYECARKNYVISKSIAEGAVAGIGAVSLPEITEERL